MFKQDPSTIILPAFHPELCHDKWRSSFL